MQAELERRRRTQTNPNKPAQRLTFLAWCLKHRRFLAPDVPFDFDARPFQRALYEDEHREVVIEKCAQVGVSEMMVSWVLYHVDSGNTALYLLPTDGDVSDFSSHRFGLAFDASEYLAGRVIGHHQRGADKVTLKRIGNAFLYLRGAKVGPGGRAPQLKSVPADVLVLDEYDEMDPKAEALSRKRLGASDVAQVRIASTPTYATTGIHPLYLASDQRRWHIPCPHCGERNAPGLGHLVTEWDDLERPVRWNTLAGRGAGNADAPSEIALLCQKCQRPLDRGATGEWVAAYPSRDVHGYHLSALFVAQRPLSEIIAGLTETDESKRKETYNQALGLPYRTRGATSLTDDVLDACRREYGMGPRKGGAFVGIDVGRVLHVVIRGPDWGLRAAFEHADFDAELRSRLIEYGALACVIDANPETRAARNFQASFPKGFVWLAYYIQGRASSQVAALDFERWDSSGLWVGNVKADRTRTLDTTRGLFAKGAKGERGGATLPANARSIPDYYDHLKALERTIAKDAQGNSIAVYTQTGPDHYAHAENYCYMAAAFWLEAAENRAEVVHDPVQIGRY